MFQVKKIAPRAAAYRLGEDCEELQALINRGLVIPREGGYYEVFSQEAVRSGAEHGEKAWPGDYVKVDGSGYPYPLKAEWFEANHRRIRDHEYEQIPEALSAWDAGEPMCPEIRYLIEHRGLVIRPDDFDRMFTAPLWGTVESAAGDAVIVFYSLTYAEDGSVADAVFNFVAGEEFLASYERC